MKNHKNDAEAVARPNMRFVAIKSIAQQNIQAMHRVRSEQVKQRTAKVNQIRVLLAEYGIIVGQRVGVLRHALPQLLEDAENYKRVWEICPFYNKRTSKLANY